MHLNAENARQIIRPRGGEIVEEEGKKSRAGTRVTPKMLKMKGECAGMNRQEAEDEKSLRARSSEPLGPEFCAAGREAGREA